MSPSFSDAKTVWTDVLNLASQYQDDPSTKAWLERILPCSMDESGFVAVAQFKWTEQNIMTNYRPLIEEWLKQITLSSIPFRVIVDSSLYSEIKAAMSEQGQESEAPDALSPSGVASLANAVPSDGGADAQKEVSEALGSGNTQQMSMQEEMDIIPEGVQSTSIITNSNQQCAETQPDNAGRGPAFSTKAEEKPGSAGGAPASDAVKAPSPQVAIRDFTFDTFVVGAANNMAYEVARKVAEGDSIPANPIFFYSKSGLGKTHLLFAILNYIHMYRNEEVNVVYASSNDFTEDYIEDIVNHKRRGKEVMKKYRNCDLLLIDDVQFLVNKQETMTTFFDIFNQLIYQGKIIVLTADEPPDYLQLDERMKTRFNSGTVLSIAQPSQELKLSILKSYYERKCSQIPWFRGMKIGDKELSWIAQYSPNSIREMLGFLNTIMLKESDQPKQALTEDRIRSIHDEMYKEEQKIELSTIVKVVAKEYGVSEQDMRGKRRTKLVSEARQVSMWLARQMTDGTYESIGSYFDRDHTTALCSISKIERMSQSDRTFMYRLEHLQKSIKNR